MTSDPLPAPFSAWVRELLGGPIPSEPQSTCSDCAMCTPDAGEWQFEPDLKCCTFVPDVPSFMVGGVLASDDPALAFGRDAMRQRLAGARAATPMGLSATPAEQSALGRIFTTLFGQSDHIVCPYFQRDSGHCGIWPYRDGVCSTWFCKQDRGKLSEHFWRAIHRLLLQIQRSLVLWCMLELELDSATLDTLFAEPTAAVGVEEPWDAAGDMDETRRRAAWGPWFGREEAYFLRCRELVMALGWADLLAVAGPGVKVSAQIARDAFEDLGRREVPDRLTLDGLHVIDLGAKVVEVQGYSQFDRLRLPRRLVDALHYFDGRRTTKALRAIKRKAGLTLDENQLIKLVDFGILETP